MLRKLIAKYVGTLLLLATVVGSGIMGESLADGAGVLIAHGMFELEFLQVSSNVRTGGGQWLAEAVATFGLVGTILAVLKQRPEAVPYAVGLYITAGYWFSASTSFANPAVTIARAFTDTFSGILPGDVAAFILAQLIGAVIATGLMGFLMKDETPD